MLLRRFERKAHQEHSAAVVNMSAAHAAIHTKHSVHQREKLKISTAVHLAGRAAPAWNVALKGKLFRHEQDHIACSLLCQIAKQGADILCFTAAGAAED